MSDEAQEQIEVTESTDQPVETIEESQPTDETTTNEAEEVQETEEVKESQPDLVAEAQAEQDALKAELEALKTDDTNIFERNAQLKAEVEEAKKLQEVASENVKLKAQLQDAKRQTIIDGMLKKGQITNDLRTVTEGMDFDTLQAFAKSLPRKKTIVEEVNNGAEGEDVDFDAWKLKMKQSRIVS